MHPPVDAEIYQAIAAACGKDFAYSYLVQAGQRDNRVFPWTVTAFERLMSSPQARQVFARRGVTLEKPEPWSEGRVFMGGARPAKAA